MPSISLILQWHLLLTQSGQRARESSCGGFHHLLVWRRWCVAVGRWGWVNRVSLWGIGLDVESHSHGIHHRSTWICVIRHSRLLRPWKKEKERKGINSSSSSIRSCSSRACALHTQTSFLKVFIKAKTRNHLSFVPEKTQVCRTACNGNQLVKQKARMPQATTIQKRRQREVWDPGWMTGFLLSPDSGVKSYERTSQIILWCAGSVSQSASQIDNFPSRHGMAKQ